MGFNATASWKADPIGSPAGPRRLGTVPVVDRLPSPRLCARPGCASVAVASLSYDYARRIAWLDDLPHAPRPSCYELCATHAQSLRVPLGWRHDDRRSPATPLFHTAAPSSVAV
ncbi:MAG: DUF3499 family protein [Actinobacteria bacterium]|nr:MAG: DUF3499 family protein [Actinomycetota bacterium]